MRACSGDTVTGLSETYDTRNVGTGKTLTVAAGYTVTDGNSGGNYTVALQSTNTTGSITQGDADDHGGFEHQDVRQPTSATATPTVAGLVGDDTVTGLARDLRHQKCGQGKTLTVSAGYTVIDGNSGGNYTVATTTMDDGRDR